MKVAFADTFYFLALLDTREQKHQQVLTAARDSGLKILTTQWVLLELADAYCHPQDRADFVSLYRLLQADRRVEIVPATPELFQRGVDFYEQRPDKNWSLTDCLSFLAMADRGVKEALTGDRHFQQAGFSALFL